MTNNVTFKFNVDDTTWAVHNKYLARQIELVTLNTLFSVVCLLNFPSHFRLPFFMQEMF